MVGVATETTTTFWFLRPTCRACSDFGMHPSESHATSRTAPWLHPERCVDSEFLNLPRADAAPPPRPTRTTATTAAAGFVAQFRFRRGNKMQLPPLPFVRPTVQPRQMFVSSFASLGYLEQC